MTFRRVTAYGASVLPSFSLQLQPSPASSWPTLQPSIQSLLRTFYIQWLGCFSILTILITTSQKVGKFTFPEALKLRSSIGKEVGLLDIDICGPSIPRMLNLEGNEVHQSNEGWQPVYFNDTLAVMSIGFMLGKSDDAIIWRGPRKNGLIR